MPTIHVIETRLTDQSVVHNVRVPEMRLAAISKESADALARVIADAIRRHTNESVRIEEL